MWYGHEAHVYHVFRNTEVAQLCIDLIIFEREWRTRTRTAGTIASRIIFPAFAGL